MAIDIYIFVHNICLTRAIKKRKGGIKMKGTGEQEDIQYYKNHPLYTTPEEQRKRDAETMEKRRINLIKAQTDIYKNF